MKVRQDPAPGRPAWGAIDQKPCLLIVDDEPRILESLEDLLEDDFEVLTTSDARKALDLLHRHEVAVLLTDQRMPGLTGDELLARAAEFSQATRVLVTGYSDLQALSRAVNRGHIYAYVAKPWNPDELRVTLNRAAEHYRLLKGIERERRLLQQLMDSSRDQIYFTDAEGRLLRVNRAVAAMLGVEDPEELIGQFPSAVLPPPAGRRFERDLRRIRESGEPILDQVDPLPTREGTRWLSTTVSPRRDGRGGLKGAIAIARDVTERVQASRTLERRARQQEGLAKLSQAALAGDAPEDLAARLGALLTEALEEGAVRVLRPDQEELRSVGGIGREGAVSEAARKAFETGRVEVESSGEEGGVIAVPIPDEPRPWGILEAVQPAVMGRSDEVPFLEAAANVLAMALRAREARHALVRAEERFHQSQKMEALGRLAGGVAHDFNNLLTVIRGGCELIEAELPSSHSVREPLGAVQAAAGRAGELTCRLLRFSRREEARPRVLDLNRALADSETMLRRVLGERVDLVTRLSETESPVWMDPGQFDQILMNLVVNARDAMPQGGRIRVELGVVDSVPEEAGVKPGPCVRLRVADEGAGMAPETRARIFEPFFTTKETDRGTGLGLATVLEVTRRFGGGIQVESIPGCGTCFSLYFPRVAQAAETETETGPVSSGPARTGSETVLVVDDDDSVRTTVTRALQRLGYRILEAADGAQALDASRSHTGPLDLLVTDVGLPRMNGVELGCRLREERPGVPILLISGYSAEDLGLAGEADASVELLSKPFTLRELGSAVRRALEGVPPAPVGAT